MLKNILIVVCGLGLIAALAGREWLIYKELEVKKSEIGEQLQRALASARSLEDLQSLQSSELVYSRYLEPVIFTASRLLVPNLRADIVGSWEREVHQSLVDEIRMRSMKMEEGVESSIKQTRKSTTAGHDRLLTVARLSQGLLSTLARIDLIESEIEAIDKKVAEEDSARISELKNVGIDRLKALKDRMTEWDEVQLAEYLSSRAFSDDVLSPVLDVILDIEQSNLRKATWNQFEKKLYEILSRQTQLLAQQRSSENSAVQSIAELLKKEFERDQKEKAAVQRRVPPSSPADSMLYQ